MANWLIHSFVGIILGIFCVMLNSGLNQDVLFAAVLATVLGALIPDIDHRKSKIRGVFRIILILVLLLFIYLALSSYFNITPDVSNLLTGDVFLVLLIFAFSVFFASIITSLVESLIPRHRGPIHRVFASIFYAFSVLAVSSILGFDNSIIIAIWGFIGYLSHLIIDILI